MNQTTCKIKVRLGYGGDYGVEYWSEEDWNRWRAYVDKLKEDGDYGKVVEMEMTLVHNPQYDDVTLAPLYDRTLSSFKMEFLNFSKF